MEAVSSSCQTSLRFKPDYEIKPILNLIYEFLCIAVIAQSHRRKKGQAQNATRLLLHGDKLRQPDLNKGNQLCPTMPTACGHDTKRAARTVCRVQRSCS